MRIFVWVVAIGKIDACGDRLLDTKVFLKKSSALAFIADDSKDLDTPFTKTDTLEAYYDKDDGVIFYELFKRKLNE